MHHSTDGHAHSPSVLWWSALITALMLLMSAKMAAAGERKLGTIGPPPRQDPQRMNSAESMPPLPLPATPLRRSEPKAEPSPPTFIGKLAWGTTQDYMPNPGDVDNLLRNVRQQLDVWYGQRLVSADEIAATYEAGKEFQLPLLYVTGYHRFELTDAQREAIRNYLFDGGTLVADATLGSPAFVESFLEEMVRMFPQHRMDNLQLDHPIYRGYYQYANVHYYTIEKGMNTQQESPPRLMGLNLAARTAVILSPFDMTCGWDGFYAPPSSSRVPDAGRSMAMMPNDAVRMGVNIVAYTSAQRRFAKAQAQSLKLVGEQPQPRAAVQLGHLRHHGDWNPDPNSLRQLIRLAAQQTSMPMAMDLRPVDADLSQLIDTPVIIMTGMDEPRLDDNQVAALRRHLQAGGFLFINNTSGFAKFDREARDLVARLLPDSPLQAVPADHPLMHSLFNIEGASGAYTHTPKPVDLEAATIDGRAVVVYSPSDTLAMLKGVHDPYSNAYDGPSAQRLALNVLSYAMQR